MPVLRAPHPGYHPRTGDSINQTFFRPKGRSYESTYYDIHLNQAQIERVWPKLNDKLLILEAARIAFETAEEIGIEDLVSSDSQTPAEKLSYHVNAFLVRDLPLSGCRPPSTASRIIPNAVQNRLHHIVGTNSLTSDFASESARYDEVTIRRFDLDDYLQSLRRAAREGI